MKEYVEVKLRNGTSLCYHNVVVCAIPESGPDAMIKVFQEGEEKSIVRLIPVAVIEELADIREKEEEGRTNGT